MSTNFTTDTLAFQAGVGEKVVTLIQLLGTFVTGFAIAFAKGWLMTLVVSTTLPVMAMAGYFYLRVIQNKDKKLQSDYAKAGGRAEQAIASIKTIKQLNG